MFSWSTLLLLALIKRAACADVSVSIPLQAPAGASPVSPGFIGLSIEQDRWTDWVGLSSRNTYFYNVLQNLQELSGHTPDIRIGANSEDRTNFRADIRVPELVFPKPTPVVPYPEAQNITVGDAYYDTVRFLPPNTRVTWGLNFGQSNVTAATLSAQSILRAFDSGPVRDAQITLEALQLGNEPDLYANNNIRSNTYNIQQYVSEWTKFTNQVRESAGATSTRIWALTFAHSTHQSSGFSPQAAFDQGLLSSSAGEAISTISQHHYSGSFCSGNGDLLQNLMTKSNIRNNLDSFIPDIAAVHAKGLEYILGETNSYSCHGVPGVSNVAGAAIWALDYILHASQIGISRLFFHEGIGFKYNLIQPVTLTRSILDGSDLPQPLSPHIHPQYYAAVIANEAIGRSESTHVVELNVTHPQIAGYAFFEDRTLRRAVFINSQAYLKSSSSPRGSQHLKIDFLGQAGPSEMAVKRLDIRYADDTNNLNWGGVSYETGDGKPAGGSNVQHVPVSVGLDIAATEVVMLSFE